MTIFTCSRYSRVHILYIVSVQVILFSRSLYVFYYTYIAGCLISVGTVPRSDSQIISCSQNLCRVCLAHFTYSPGRSFWLEPLGNSLCGEKYYEERVLHILYKGKVTETISQIFTNMKSKTSNPVRTGNRDNKNLLIFHV